MQAFYAAWNRADRNDTTARFLAADFEYVNPDNAIDRGVRQGLAGWRAVLQNLDAAFEDYGHRAGEFVDLGERILCYATFVARARGSAMTLERDEQQLWTVRDGEITRLHWFHDPEAARRAAGIT